MRSIRSLVVTRNLNLASLWQESTPDFDNRAAVFCPYNDEATQALFETRFPSLQMISTPAEALEWGPDVVVATEPGYSTMTDVFLHKGIHVVNSGAFLDKLDLDPEVSRNAITLLFSPQTSRRYIALHSNDLMIQSEAMYYSLRYPDDQYVMDIGDTRDSLILVSAKEVLQGIEPFKSILGAAPSLYCHRTRGLLCHREEWPTCIFSLVGLYGGSRIGRPIISWQNGPDAVASWIDDDGLISNLDKLAASHKIRGALTLRCCLDSAGNVQVFRIDAGMDPWLFPWLRLKLAPDQSWGSLWKSLASGASFQYHEGAVEPTWCCNVPRDSGLAMDEGQIVAAWPGYDSTFLMGKSLWQPRHFDLAEFTYLERIAKAGLLEKRPLWAATEITKVEQYLQPKPYVVNPHGELEPLPPLPPTPEVPETEGVAGEIQSEDQPEPKIKEEELVNA